MRLDLLTLLIGLFILSSCNPEDKIGLELDSADQLQSYLVDTATIRTTTVREDTTLTSGLGQHTLGYLQDPDLGTTESNLAMALSLPSTTLSFGTAPILDSAVLVLRYGDEFYGDSVSSTYRIDVRQLSEEYKTSSSYYNNKSWTAGSAIIGGKTINKFTLHDSVYVNQIRKAKRDTIIRRSPHLRIPMSSAFITNTILNASTDALATSASFNAYIKGLYLTINKGQSAGKGGIATFDLSTADSSSLEVYYRNVNGTTIDTNVVNFRIFNSYAANNIVHQYSATVLTQLNNPSQQFSTVFVQPMAGLRTRLNFPHLDKLKTLGNIVINKAELVIQVLNSSLDPAPRLTLYRTDIASQRQPVPDNNVGQSSSSGVDPRYLSEFAFGGFYDKVRKRYIISITSYIQDILNGKLTQYDTYLAPSKANNLRTSNSDLKPFATTAARSILGGGNNTQYRMKLNIYYTKVK